MENTPRKTYTQLQAHLEQTEVVVSAKTIHRTLNKVGLHGRRPRRKLQLKIRHKKARLKFAKTFIDKPQSFWDNVD